MQAGKKYHLVLVFLCNKMVSSWKFCNPGKFFSGKAVAIKPGCVYFAVIKNYIKWNTGTSGTQI